ncbi:hypothetical protein [Spirosoma aerolatum]|uniref:hypothetical protein n=1 Tax=Spirosoma aerolatum TaxID=1211326 RepID=UPI0012D355D7|nr:hypothetical protein [Spirosoma aerolatum]
MKSLFPYVVMGALFVAGNRLVDRQQQYKCSERVPAQETSPYGAFTANTGVSKMQLTNSPTKPVLADQRALKNTPM